MWAIHGHVRDRKELAECRSGIGVDLLRRGDEFAAFVEQQHEVCVDALQVIVGGRQLGVRITRGHGFAEAEIRSQHTDAARELRGAKPDHLLDERPTGAQFAGRSPLDRGFHAREHCDQRHTLCDDDQPNDQHEKSVAETAHRIGSNMKHRSYADAPWGREQSSVGVR